MCVWGGGGGVTNFLLRDRRVCLPRRGKLCACLPCFNSQKSLRHEVPTGDYSYTAACVLSAITRRLRVELRVELRPICLEHFQGGGAKWEDLTTGVFFKPALSHIQL